MNLTGWSSDRVLYVGDHVYMDLAVSASASANSVHITEYVLPVRPDCLEMPSKWISSIKDFYLYPCLQCARAIILTRARK